MLHQSTHTIIDAQSGNTKTILKVSYKEKLLNIFDLMTKFKI